MKLFFATILVVLGLTSSTDFREDENSQKRIYIAHKLGLHQKYGILEVEDTIANLEVYTKYDGEYVPVNMSWNSKIDPEKYVLKKDTADSLGMAFRSTLLDIIISDEEAFVDLKCTFMGGFDLDFHRVKELPKKYDHIRNHAYMFTGRNEVGYQYKTEGGYESYDKIMKGNILYKECDELNFHEFVTKYDSVQQSIFFKMALIQDSLKYNAAMEQAVEGLEDGY